ncbi:peptidoglycan DD-metalloendopeptidase family protein [Butyricicoccus pullicaecorum]|nr:peptidoglycan DD-metalloendopeptidase family protein [Butyricicoccus pullicaecorum]
MYNSKRKRIIAAIIAGLLAVLMLGSTIFGAIGMASAASKSELKSRLAQIKEHKAEIERNLESYKADQAEYAGQIGTLNNKIALTEEEIDATQDILDELDANIAQTEQELEETTQELENKKELFATRIRVMYENGDTSYMDVLLNSENFSDMLSNMEIVSQIMDYDKGVVAEYTALKESIEQMKAELESDRADKQDYMDSLEDRKEELESDRTDLKKLLAKLENDIEYAEKTARQMQADEDKVNAEIEELSRQEAEAARKAAEAAKKAAQSKSASSSTSTSTVRASGSMVWPCPSYNYISSNYGYRTHPITGKVSSFHKGIDIAASSGNPVLAAASGTVVKSYMSSSYGNYIVISHGGGLMTAYAHLSRRLVSVGDTVSAGQQIGKVGSTGNSTGPHLHFEVYVNGSTVNPMNYV